MERKMNVKKFSKFENTDKVLKYKIAPKIDNFP